MSVGWGYLWLSMVSVKADVEAAGVGVSGLGLPAVSTVSVKASIL